MDRIEAILGRDQWGSVNVEYWREEVEFSGTSAVANKPTMLKGHKLYESTRDFMYQNNLNRCVITA